MVNSELMEQWLSDFRRHMSLLPTEEREEIVREIAAHMRDAAEQPGIRPEEILARLGDAKQLAAEYRDGSLIRQASRSYSPLLLLRGSLRMATKA